MGTISILASSVAFFELFGEMRLGHTDGLSVIPALGIFALALWGITAVRSGMSHKRKTS